MLEFGIFLFICGFCSLVIKGEWGILWGHGGLFCVLRVLVFLGFWEVLLGFEVLVCFFGFCGFMFLSFGFLVFHGSSKKNVLLY